MGAFLAHSIFQDQINQPVGLGGTIPITSIAGSTSYQIPHDLGAAPQVYSCFPYSPLPAPVEPIGWYHVVQPADDTNVYLAGNGGAPATSLDLKMYAFVPHSIQG